MSTETKLLLDAMIEIKQVVDDPGLIQDETIYEIDAILNRLSPRFRCLGVNNESNP